MAREAGRLPQHLYCSRILYDRAEKAREDAHFHAKSQVSACFKASSSASDATTTSRIPTVHHGASPPKDKGTGEREEEHNILLIKERAQSWCCGPARCGWVTRRHLHPGTSGPHMSSVQQQEWLRALRRTGHATSRSGTRTVTSLTRCASGVRRCLSLRVGARACWQRER